MNFVKLVPVLGLFLLLGGCATTPDRMEELELARGDLQALANDPLTAREASEQLKASRDALASADEALEKRAPRDRIVHLAYVARRQAQIGLAEVAEARARQQVAEGEAQRGRILLQSREREAATATREARSAQAQAQSARSEADLAKTEAQSAMEEARMQTMDAEAARAQMLQMQQAFADLQAKQTERGMVLTLGDVLFDTGQATLKAGADLTLNRLGEFLNKNPETRIVIEGHTDSVGSEEYNEALSQRRARAVSSALQSRGISAERFETRGRGERYPVATNDSAAGRQQNRRVEIVFSDLSGQFAQGATSQ